MIPILAGHLGEHLSCGRRLSEVPEAKPFLETLRGLCDPETLVVAGVDFSHVGLKFGHPQPAIAYQDEFQEHDMRLLAALTRGAAEELWEEAIRVEDRFNVCGLPVLATLLEILPGLAGRLLDYRVWHEAPTQSAVSFAAACLED
jgi:predicted class III extradiol MEMO1 family dioxygenase